MRHSIIVFGGQGRTGREVVSQALSAGHNVTAFTRSDNHTIPHHKRLMIVEGNARSAHDVRESIKGHDIVINIIAPRLFDKKNYDISLVATKNIVNAMQALNIERYYGQCGAWGTEFASDASLFMRIGFAIFWPLRGIYRFKKLEDQIIKSSKLKWTIVRAGILTNGPKRWPVKVIVNRYKCSLFELPTISRKSLASFYTHNLDNEHMINTCPIILQK